MTTQNQTAAWRNWSRVRVHIHVFLQHRRRVYVYELVFVCMFQRRHDSVTVSPRQMTELTGLEKWRFDDEIYIAYHFVIICLIVKICLFRTYRNHNYRWKLKLSWNFICKSVYFIRFNSCRIECFCPNTGSLMCHLQPFTDCQGRKGQFSSIFTSVLKWSRHFIQIVFI